MASQVARFQAEWNSDRTSAHTWNKHRHCYDDARGVAGVIRCSVGRRQLSVVGTGGNARNVGAIKADIGQFAITELGQFGDIALIVPERLDHADE
jgi:hypothetical protein